MKKRYFIMASFIGLVLSLGACSSKKTTSDELAMNDMQATQVAQADLGAAGSGRAE